MSQRLLATAACAAMMAATAAAMPVRNFTLADHTGVPHELYRHEDAKAVVVMVQGNGCPVVRNALIDLAGVREQFRGEPVRFLMINSNLQDDRESIRAEAEEWDIDLPILVDGTQEVGEALALNRTAEVLVIDTRSWTIAYRGPVNDRLVYERQREAADNHYLVDALRAVLAGERPTIDAVAAIGCLINFPARSGDDGSSTAAAGDHYH